MADQIERKKGKGGKPCRWYRYMPLVVAGFLFALTTGCGTLGGLFTEGEPVYVLTDSANVPPNVVPPPVPTVLPVKAPDGSETGRTYVVVDETVLQPSTPRIPIMSAPPDDSSGLLQGLSGLLAGTPLGPFAPVVALLGAKILATRRGRQHGVKALRSLAALDVGTATKAVLASDGWLHTEAVEKPTSKQPLPPETPTA